MKQNSPSAVHPPLRDLVAQGACVARATRTPCLALEHVDERFVWITDAGVRVGLIDRKECTLEWVAPHPGVPSIRPAEVPPVYHAPTYQGGRIIAQWWLTPRHGHRYLPGAPWRRPWEALPARGDDMGFCKFKPDCTWTFDATAGEHLSFRIDETFALPGAPRGCHRFSIGYDPVADSYVAEVDAEVEGAQGCIVELANFYAGGVYDTRPTRKRHQQTVWSHPDGRLVRWPHHPAGYQTPGMNDPEGERRIAEGGFIGYFTDPHTNPVIEFIETSSPVTTATCCNIFDEHLLLLTELDTDRCSASFRFYSVTESVAKAIVARSELVRFGLEPDRPNPVATDVTVADSDLSRRINYHPQYPVLRHGCINTFEEMPALDRTVPGCMLFVSGNPDHDIWWADNCGHSGQRSIRLRGREPGGTTGTRSGGPTPHLDPGQRYRLSGWIKCEGVTGGARLRFDEIGFRPREKAAPSHVAGPLSGTCDWTYVECEFTTLPTAQFGWYYLDLEGAGQAWFDDVVLEEC
jgi:hypothetical protein